jgi:hypothetical protein
MRIWDFSRSAFGSCVAAAMLAGCGGSQPPIGAPGAMAQTAALQGQAAQRNDSGSWMAPDAASQDLLYVSDTHTVTVYSYPKGKLEGTIRFGYLPGGQCVDSKGNVFITDTDTGQIFEYAHGGKKPVAVLKSPADDPLGCSIDPITGDLAVSSLGFGNDGAVGVYKGAKGSPKLYKNSAFHMYYFCGYDSSGNLFVDGQNGSSGAFEFAELAKGERKLKSVILNQSIESPGGVQWDGKYVAVGDQSTPVVYQFNISGGVGSEVGSTSLGGSDVTVVLQYFIFGSRLIAPNQCNVKSCYGNVLYYPYPSGGTATKTITKGVRFPRGVVVSKAPI